MKKLKYIIIVMGSLMFFNFLHAQNNNNHAAFWKKISLWPETLSATQMMEASLAASGVYGEAQQSYIDYYNRVKKSIDFSSPEKILSSMHVNFLKGNYSAMQTQLDVLLKKGTFNCVSSAILYMILVKQAGFSVRGIQTQDHAFCMVQNVDVETTNPYGYNPGTKKEFSNSFSHVTGFIYVPPTKYHQRNAISDKQMVSLIFQNRISILLRQRKFKEGKQLAEMSWIFYPSKSNLHVLSTTVEDVAGELNNKHLFDEALKMVVSFSKKFNIDEQKIITTLLDNKATILAASKNLAGMQKMLSEWHSYLTKKQISFLEKNIVLQNIQNNIDKILNDKSKSAGERYFTVYIYITKLPSEQQSLTQLHKMKDMYYHNWTAAVHNDFAHAVNSRQFKKAQLILEEALKKDPSNKTLQHDLKSLLSR